MAVVVGVRGRERSVGLEGLLPQTFLDVCLRSDAHKDWCLYLVGKGKKPAVGLPPELIDLIKYLLERGVIDRVKLKELGSEVEKVIIQELKDVSKEVREAMAQAVASKKPEVLEGKIKELVERMDKLVPIGKVVLPKEPKEFMKEVIKTELRPDIAEEVSKLVSKPIKEVETQIKAIAEKVVKTEAKKPEELVTKVSKVEVSKELPPIVKPRAELRK
jgi:BMFP domain-containing protein YqiC